MMTVLAGFVMRHPRKIVGLWCALGLVGVLASSNLTGRLQNGGYDVPGSPSAKTVDVGKTQFGDKAEAQAYISIITPGLPLAALLHDATRLGVAARGVHGVQATGTAIFSSNRRALLVPVLFAGGLGAAQVNDPAVEAAIGSVNVSPARAGLIGQVPVFNRYEVNAKRTLQQALVISLPITLVVLLFAFLSVVAAALPLVLALVCIGVTFGLVSAELLDPNECVRAGHGPDPRSCSEHRFLAFHGHAAARMPGA